MSESTLAIDHAWSVLKGDGIEKAAFLAPLVFGGLGAATGSGARLGRMEEDPEAFFGYRPVFDPGFHADAAVYDPITGAVKVKELGDSPMDRAIGFGTGALQAVNPMTYIGAGGKLIGAGGKAVRTSDRFADTVRVADGVTDTTAGPMQVLGQGAGRRIEGAGQGIQRFAASRPARFTGRAGQVLGNAYTHFGPGGAAMFGAGLGNMMGLLGGEEDQDSGFGMQGQTQGFGSGGLGINDISNVQSNAVADRQIWNPDAYRSDPRAVGFEGQQEFGGFGTTKGEHMFVNNKGEEIRKQVEEMMNKAKCAGCTKPECMGKMTCPYGQGGDMTAKAKCPKCGKADCVGKMGCGMAKAEDKKKPAHGMVIVIGSKAGPGPSKEGKREKLDSEKKEE